MNKKLKAVFTLVGLGGIMAASMLANAPAAEAGTSCRREYYNGCEKHNTAAGWCGNNLCNGMGVKLSAYLNNWQVSITGSQTAYASLYCTAGGVIANVYRGGIYNNTSFSCPAGSATGVDFCGPSTSCQNM